MYPSPLNILPQDTARWNYSALLTPPEGGAECALLPSGDIRSSVGAPVACSERHLQVLWLEQNAFSPLLSHPHKLPIEVIHPGIWNQGPGPDFLHAHIRVGDRSYQGAIELHLSDSGWVQHGHASDPRYEEVILHVSLEPPLVEKPLFTLSGRNIDRAYLGPSLTTPLQTLLSAIDLDLYPSSSCTRPGMCAQGLFDTLSPAEIHAFFHSAARWRLHQKRLFLTHFSPDPSMQCAIGIALSLGYRQNARTMARLFLQLFPHRHLDKEVLLAQALGRCGFFNAHYQTLWGKSDYYQALHQKWQAQTFTAEPLPIVTAQQRPAHHPVRRLAALICLLQYPALLHIWTQFQELWRALYDNNRPVSAFKQALIQFLPEYKEPYWSTHYTFETNQRELNLSLLGEERREIILINALFPLLWHELLLREDRLEQEAFMRLFSAWKSPLSQKQHYVSRRFFSHLKPPINPMESFMLQQGAFQLHSDFCTHYEASCIGCPFVARAQAQYHAHKSINPINPL